MSGSITSKHFFAPKAAAEESVYTEYSVNYGNRVYRATAATQADLDDYVALLKSEGYVIYDSAKIAENEHYIFEDGAKEETVFVSYFKGTSVLQAVRGKRGYMPKTEAVSDPQAVSPSFTQLKIFFGMGYIVQLSDGSFFVVDGGIYFSDEERREASQAEIDNIYYQLKKLHDSNSDPNKSEKPQITWFITHTHPDHLGALNQFLLTHNEDVEINTVCYNFPDPNKTKYVREKNVQNEGLRVKNFLDRMNTYYPNAKHWVMHTGQTMRFAGCRVEVLYTYEDYLHFDKKEIDEHSFCWINFTSTACKLVFDEAYGSREILIMGDCEWTAIDQLVMTYGDHLKADVMQVTHHGYSGGSIPFSNIYALSDKRTLCMWACCEEKFFDDNRTGRDAARDFNKVLREGENCRHLNAEHNVKIDVATLRVYSDGEEIFEDCDGNKL